jgi:hypothetical protein
MGGTERVSTKTMACLRSHDVICMRVFSRHYFYFVALCGLAWAFSSYFTHSFTIR